MASVKTKEEVEILSPEVVEVINQKIETSLIKENVTDKVIAKLKEDYMPLKINGYDDKEGYLAVVEARKSCKQLRVLATKICKDGRAEANATSQKWIAKEKEVTTQIAEVEDYLEKQEKDYDEYHEREKKLKAQRIEQQGIHRTADLMKFGATLIEGTWVLEDVVYESILVKSCDPDIYQGIYDQFKAIFDEREKVRIEKEENQRKAQEEFQKQQEELQRQQQEMKDMRTEARVSLLKSFGMGKEVPRPGVRPCYVYGNITVYIHDIEEKGNEEWEAILQDVKVGVEKVKEEVKEKERVRNLFADRLPRLKEWSSNGHYVYAKGKQWGTVEDIVNKTEEEFEELVKENNNYLKERDNQLELQRQQDLENARLEGIGKSRRGMLESINGASGLSDLELGSVPTEQWERDLKIATTLHENKKKEKADKEEQERQQLLGEKGRYEEYIESLKKIPIPDFRSGQYRSKISPIKAFIEGLK